MGWDIGVIPLRALRRLAEEGMWYFSGADGIRRWGSKEEADASGDRHLVAASDVLGMARPLTASVLAEEGWAIVGAERVGADVDPDLPHVHFVLAPLWSEWTKCVVYLTAVEAAEIRRRGMCRRMP